MCSSLMVFVADSYHTQASCAVLSYLQQVERRRSGRRVPFVFNPTGTPEPGLLQGADGIVLVLLEGQKAAAEVLLSFWDTLAKMQDRSFPVLPILVRTDDSQADPDGLLCHLPHTSSSVNVFESDVLLEHGGQVSLHPCVETQIDQAIHAVLEGQSPALCPARNSACTAVK